MVFDDKVACLREIPKEISGFHLATDSQKRDESLALLRKGLSTSNGLSIAALKFSHELAEKMN